MASSNGQTTGQKDQTRFAPVGVFISHKAEDHAAALTLKDIFELNAAGRVKAFISENIPGGDEWREWIKENLLSSNVFILLFTNPRETWDWCLFEAGLFLNLSVDEPLRLICLHHPNHNPPDPVRNLQTVPVQSDSLKEFLEKFFGDADFVGVDGAINEPLANKASAIEELAAEIQGLFHPFSFDPWCAHMRMALGFTPKQVKLLKTSGEIPKDVAVDSADVRILAEIFDLGPGTFTWGKLQDQIVSRGYRPWTEELARVMIRASERKIREIEIRNSFRTAGGGRIFRSVLYQVDFLDNSPQLFHLLFTEESTPDNIAGEGRLANVYQMLRVGHRFRSEVLQSYMGQMQTLVGEFGPEIACRRLREAMEVVEDEAGRLNLLDEFGLTAPFDDSAQREALTKLLDNWKGEIREALFVALRKKNISAIEENLVALRHANAEFLAICGERYAELAQAELDKVKGREVSQS